MNVGAIIQARMGSTRMPGKILKPLNNKPVLEHIFNRVNESNVQRTIIATSINKKDNIVEDFCNQNKILCFRGSEDDVLSRFYFTAKTYNLDIVVRITADDPLKDTNIINKAISLLQENSYDYVSNTIVPTYPEGIDVEVFTFETLEYAFNSAILKSEREHVTPYIWKNKSLFHVLNFTNDTNLSFMRWTMDTEDDYKFMIKIYSFFQSRTNFSINEVLDVIKKNPDILLINQNHVRNEGYLKSIKEETNNAS